MRAFKRLAALAGAFVLAACGGDSAITSTPDEFSASMSVVTISATSLEVGAAGTATLRLRDAGGNDVAAEGLDVDFGVAGGSSLVSFGPTEDHGDGTYTAPFMATNAGTPVEVRATVDGVQITSTPPMLQVVPLPPGGQVCEAIAPADCWYVSGAVTVGGVGTFDFPFRLPQDAIERAGPGDVIYLRGGVDYTAAHAASGDLIITTSGAASGAEGQLITIKSYPGEQAVIRGPVSGGVPGSPLTIRINRSHWRMEGLRIINAQVCIACPFVSGVEHVWVVGNHISDVRASAGNWGVITVHGDQLPDPGHPKNIFIHDNVVHTMWGMAHDGSGPYEWTDDPDIEHHACILLQNSAGLVEVVGNEAYECPTIFYAKYMAPGPTLIRGNYMHDARTIATAWRSSNATFRDNVFARFTVENAGFRLHDQSTTNVWENNTFDFAPWPLNPAGSERVVNWNGAGDHAFRSNVVLARIYHGPVDANFGANDIDGNCVIWSNNLLATANGHSWSEYRSTFTHDAAGVHVVETDRAAVFANPAAGDYSLIGAAASACVAAGAAS